jgi:cell division protein FtsB
MVITIVIAYFLFSPSGIINRIILTSKQKELLKDIDFEKKIQDSLKIGVSKMKSDTIEIEKIAREKYGMKFPNEKIYLVPLKPQPKKD